MALPEDFNKIYGSTATGGLTPIGDVNYAKGWEFVGSNPPTKNDFSYLQNLSDLKSQWLYSNKLQRTNPFGDIKSDGTVQTALENLGLGEAAKRGVGTGANQIPDMSAWSHSGPATGRWRKSPDGLIEQWGSGAISDAYGNAAVTFPIAFTSSPDFVLFGPRNVTAPTRMTSIVLDESNLRNTGFTCRCFDQLDGATLPSTSNFYWYCRGY